MQKLLRVIFIALILLIPAGELTRVTFTHAVSLRVLDIVVAFLFIGTIVLTRMAYLRLLVRNKYFLTFLVVLVISHLWSIHNTTYSSLLYLLRTVLYLQLPFVLDYILPNMSKKHVQTAVYLASAFLVVSALAQYILYPPLRNLLYLGFDAHYYRAVGLLFDPNLIGILLSLIALYLLNIKKNYLRLILLSSTLVSLLLTFSRISYLSLVIGLLYLSISKKLNTALVLIILVGMILVFILIPKQLGESNKISRTNSVNAKFVAWNLGIKLWKTSPLLGIGFNNSQFYKSTNPMTIGTITIRDNSFYGLDSTVLTLLVTTGIIGLIAYFLIFLSLIQTPNPLSSALALAFFVHTLSTNSFFTPTIFVFFIILYKSIQHKLL